MAKLFEVKGIYTDSFVFNAEKIVACAPNSANVHELCNVWFDSGDPWMIDVPYEQFVHLWKQALNEQTPVFCSSCQGYVSRV